MIFLRSGGRMISNNCAAKRPVYSVFVIEVNNNQLIKASAFNGSYFILYKVPKTGWFSGLLLLQNSYSYTLIG